MLPEIAWRCRLLSLRPRMKSAAMKMPCTAARYAARNQRAGGKFEVRHCSFCVNRLLLHCRACFMYGLVWKEAAPSGAKTLVYVARNGAAEAVPLQNLST